MQNKPLVNWKYGPHDGDKSGQDGSAKTGDVLPVPVNTPAPPINGYLVPDDLYNYYGFNQLSDYNRTPYNVDGAGQIIAIIDSYGSPTVQSDLDKFCEGLGIPSTQVEIYYPFGETDWNNVPQSAGGWALETTLDIQYAHAMALSATIVLVVAPDAGESLYNCVQYAVNELNANVVSMSFGLTEYPELYSPGGIDSTIFQNLCAQYVASSGDWGAQVLYPGSSPNVLSIGGTTLTYTGFPPVYTEVGWDGSGGGVSLLNPLPAYQKGWSPHKGRSVPDVSYNAGNPVWVYFTNPFTQQSGWNGVFGTSASAPQWAAIIARRNSAGYNVAGKSTINQEIYSKAKRNYTTLFYDITSGSNGYRASKGYDLITGLGSPKVFNFAPFLGTPTPTPTHTPTPTKSNTPTPTQTPTQTPTVSITPSITTSPSGTPKTTPSHTTTPTVTPTITPSNTVTPTHTATPTRTIPATPSITPSISVTPSVTPQPSRVPLQTLTPTSTVAPIPSQTPTPTPTNQNIPLPSSPPTNTPTPTPTSTMPATPTPTPTPTQTPNPSLGFGIPFFQHGIGVFDYVWYGGAYGNSNPPYFSPGDIGMPYQYFRIANPGCDANYLGLNANPSTGKPTEFTLSTDFRMFNNSTYGVPADGLWMHVLDTAYNNVSGIFNPNAPGNVDYLHGGAGLLGGFTTYLPLLYSGDGETIQFFFADTAGNQVYIGGYSRSATFNYVDGSPHRLIQNYKINGNTVTVNVSAIQYCNGLAAVDASNTNTQYVQATPVVYTFTFTETSPYLYTFNPRVVYGASQGAYNGTRDVGNAKFTYVPASTGLQIIPIPTTWSCNETITNPTIAVAIDNTHGTSSKISDFAGCFNNLYPNTFWTNNGVRIKTNTGKDYTFAYSYFQNDWLLRRDNSNNTWTAVAYMYTGGKTGENNGFGGSTLSTMQWGTNPVNSTAWINLLQPDSYYQTQSNILLFSNV